MTWKQKALISFFLQILFILAIPPLLSQIGVRYTNYIRVWEDLTQHKIFRDRNPQKAVLLGDSEFGERFCHTSPEDPGTVMDDDCTIRSIMEFSKARYPKLANFSFYDFSKNGTIAEAHLFYFLNLLRLPKGSVKYVIYAAPDKFFWELHERTYYVIREHTADLIDTLPDDVRTPELRRVAEEYRSRLSRFRAEQPFYELRYYLRRVRTRLWDLRSFLDDLVRGARDRLAPHYSELAFRHFLELHQRGGGLDETDHYKEPLVRAEGGLEFKEDRDFAFLDLILELCRIRGIQLILYFPPDRVYCPWYQLEPCASTTYEPVKARFSAKGVPVVDMRSMKFIMPRDTRDGIHPSLSAKLKIAEEFMHALEDLETKPAR